jgi:phospholipase/carboxylesterase
MKMLTFMQGVNAIVHLHWENKGHQLTFEEVAAAAKWYCENEFVK